MLGAGLSVTLSSPQLQHSFWCSGPGVLAMLGAGLIGHASDPQFTPAPAVVSGLLGAGLDQAC